MTRELRVVRAADLAGRAPDEPKWLIDGLWGAGAVGVIGGAPKSCKTFLALEMAVAVASGRPCLGRYGVPGAGPALVFGAEDPPEDVRDRLVGLARARGVDFAALDVRLIVEPALRLDRGEDVARLRATLARHRPRLLVLDPWVRLQRCDENKATEVSAVLGVLREMSREFVTSIALVHHTRKEPGAHPGQELRGSGDFHAWGDSNLYLHRRRDRISLSIEHRSAASPPPVRLEFVTGEDQARLEARDGPVELPLSERIVELLAEAPRRLDDLRELLRVRKQALLEILRALEAEGRVARQNGCWRAVNGRNPS
jgi:hypothetical protein